VRRRLTTDLDSDGGLVRAVDALSLIERGETFALVGGRAAASR
jgi:hypothetical protein